MKFIIQCIISSVCRIKSIPKPSEIEQYFIVSKIFDLTPEGTVVEIGIANKIIIIVIRSFIFNRNIYLSQITITKNVCTKE